MDSEALQGWLIKSVEHSRKLCVSVKYFVEWMANQIPPWTTYREIIPGLLIVLDKIPGVHPVGIGEKWHRIFEKCVLKVTVSEANHACRDDHICTRLKVGINRSVHGVKYIWKANLTEENRVFNLLTQILHLTI